MSILGKCQKPVNLLVGRFLLVALLAVLTSTQLSASDSYSHAVCLEQCRAAVANVEAMLAAQPSVAGSWRTFLCLPELVEQIERGPAADAALIEKVARRLESDSPGLAQPQLQQLKSSITAWESELCCRPWPEVWDRAQAGAAELKPVEIADVDAARKVAVDKLQLLDAALNAQKESGPSWRAWLQWNLVQHAVVNNLPNKLPPQRHVLWQEARFLWADPALPVADEAIRTWQQLHARQQAGETAESLQARLLELQNAYAIWLGRPTPKRLAEVTADVRALENMGLAEEVTRKIRRLHSQPNLLVLASRAFIERETQQDINDTFPIAETIAGAAVQGSGKFQGRAILNLVPTERAAALDVNLTASVNSKTSSTTSGVKIDTRGTTQVVAKKRLTVGGLGMRIAPTQTTANCQIHLDNLDAGGKLRQRVAMQQYTEAQGAAKQDSEAKTALYVSTRLDQQVAEMQQRMTTGDASRYIGPLLSYRPGFARWWRTTGRGVEGRFWAVAADDFAATQAPPFVQVQGGLAVQTHETFIERSLAMELSNKSIKSSELQERLGGRLPKLNATPAEIEDLGSDWTIVFAAHPVRMKFDNEIVRLTLYCQSFTSEKGEFPGLQVMSAFRVVCRPPQVELVREAIDVVPIDYSEENPVQLSGRQQMLRRMVERMFESEMPKSIMLPALKPSEQNRLKAPLEFVQANADRGWFTLALEPPVSR